MRWGSQTEPGRRRCVLIEREPKFAELIKVRLSKPMAPTMFDVEAI